MCKKQTVNLNKNSNEIAQCRYIKTWICKCQTNRLMLSYIKTVKTFAVLKVSSTFVC